MPSEPTPSPDFTPVENHVAATPPPVDSTSALPASTDLLTPPPTGLTDSGLTPNVAAGLAVLLTIVSGVVFLFLEKRNQFVRFWAMQAIFFGAASLVFVIVSSVISAVLAHVLWLLYVLWALVALVVNLAFLAVWIVMLVKAFGGKEWEVPYIGKLARQQLVARPVV